MFKSFLAHLRAAKLFTESDRLLLATSGGLDSTVLAYLLREGGFDLALAHVNFQLRGEESDGDERFVRDLADQLGVDYFVTRFETAAEAADRGESIQMTARRLRYAWLERIRAREGFDYILTAHHNDDRIETFLLHFLRGTGIRGLSSIPAAEGYLRRPLLYTDRETIAAFAEREEIRYRNDRSNATDDYDRNYLRHHVLPRLRELEPGLTQRTVRNFAHLREERQILEERSEVLRRRHCRQLGEELRIDRNFLQNSPGGATYLHYWLAEYPFTAEQLRQALSARPGTLLVAAKHQLLVRPDTLLVRPLRAIPETEVALPGPGRYELPDGGYFELSAHAGSPDFSDPRVAYLPAARLNWPLRLRHWREGDRFQPFGMEGRTKKLQNFFTDGKINRLDRESVWLLCDAEDRIVWVVGRRTDERYRLKEEAEKILRCEYLPAGSRK